MFLSVIIPVFNKEKTLAATIDSILNVRSDEFELLLIDDGSTDGCGKVCDDYAAKDSRVKVFHKVNGGVSSARNLGIDNAGGDYVYFCDADDTVVTETLFYGLELLKTVSADFFVFDFQYRFIDDGRIVKSGFKLPQGLLDKNNIIDLMLSRLVLSYVTDMAALWHKFFSMSVIKQNGVRFEEKVHKGEDWRFVLDFLDVAGSAYYEPQIIYVYNLEGTRKQSKYKKEAGIHLLGSPKRLFYLNEKYSLGASENKIFAWHKDVLDAAIYSVKNLKDKKKIKEILNDEAVIAAAKRLKCKKKKDFYAAEISRRYKIYAYMFLCKSRFLIKTFAKET